MSIAKTHGDRRKIGAYPVFQRLTKIRIFSNHSLPILLALLILVVPSPPQINAQQPPHPANRAAAAWLPDSPLLALELHNPDQLLERFHEALDAREFFDSDAFRQLESNPKVMQARVGLAGLAATAGVDPWRAVGAAIGREAALGIWPGAVKTPRALLAIELRDAALIDRLLHAIHGMAGLMKNGAPDPARSINVGGVRVFSISPDLHHARVADALLISNNRDLLTEALALGKGPAAAFASSDRYRAVVKGISKHAIGWAFADLKALRALMPDDADREGPRANPLGGLLFGAWWQTLMTSNEGMAWIDVHDNGVRLTAKLETAAPLAPPYRGFLPQNKTRPDWTATRLPRFLSELRIYRGWADLFGEREALLTTPASSQLVNFATTMSTLFNGMDFLNDVLPKIDAPMRLIAVRQDFSQRDIIPVPKLPAFALIAPLRPETAREFAPRLASASQTALTLVNYGLTQEGKASYLVDIDRYKGVKLLFTQHSGPPSTSQMSMDAPRDPQNDETTAKDAPATDSRPARIIGAPPVYNFAPAVAVVGDQYVVATTRELLNDVIDAIQGGAKAAGNAGAIVDSLAIDGASLAAILNDNRDEMITQRMLAENESREAAGATIDLILQLAQQVGELRVTSQAGERGMQGAIELTLSAAQAEPALKERAR